MSGEVRYLEFAEGVAVTMSTTPIFVNASSFGVYANDAAFVTAKGSAAAQGDAYLNSTDGKIHYYNTLWEIVEAAKNNLAATTAPTANDDFASDNYTVGSKWCDTTNDKIYIAIDVTTCAAVWLELVTATGTQTITGVKTFSAITTISNTTTSTTKDTGALVVEGGVGIEENLNVGGNVVIAGDLTVNGTNTILNTSTLEVEDANIIINNGGNKTSADNIAGITVEMSDNTHGSIKYQSTLTSRFKVGDAGSEAEVATVSGAQAITNKDIDGGTASNTSRITVPKNTRANLEGLTRKEGTIVYDTDSDIFLGDNGSALAAFGGGGGEYNFLSSKLIGDFFTYDDGDVAIPVDGTGGTASYISVATSPSPITNETGVLNLRISKANGGSARGEGVSVNFATRGLVDRAAIRVVKINITSSANYIDNAFGAYLEDVTNSRLIYPADQNIKASSFVSQQQFSFQLSPDSDSYRMILHCQDATVTTAYDLDLTMKIVEQKVGSGTVETDWTSWTPTGSWTTNTTYTGKYRRSGDTADFDVYIALTGAPDSTGLLVNLPTGITVDTAKMSSTNTHIIGIAQIKDQGTNSYYGRVLYYTTTAVYVAAEKTDAAYDISTQVTQAIPFTFGNTDSINIKFSVPIAGWSSNTVMSEDVGNRAIVFSSSGLTSTTTLPANTNTILPISLAHIRRDSVAGWDATNNWYLVQEGGDYHIDMSVLITAGATAPSVISLSIKRYIASTGSTIDLKVAETTNTVANKEHELPAICTERLEKNDRIYFVGYSGSQASTVYGVSNYSRGSIFKIASPQTIAQSDKVYCEYNTTAGQAVGTSATLVVYGTKVRDTHNAVTTDGSTTWLFKAPRSGIASVFYENTSASVTLSTAQRITSWVANAANTALGGVTRQNGTGVSTQYILNTNPSFYLNKDDTIKVVALSSVATNFETSAYANRIVIKME